MLVYVASPLGFSLPGAYYYGAVLLPALRAAGLEPLDPWAAGGSIEQALGIQDHGAQLAALAEADRAVALANEDMIARSAGVFAVLDGPDVDSGTAAEIGWASARGVPIVGWRSDLRASGDNAGTVVNLQVQHFIERTGGRVERDLQVAIDLLGALLSAAR